MQQQISLYLELRPGSKVDLETAARAALAFDALLKELAFAVDPFSTVRVELESGTEGSLSLNSVIKAVKGEITPKRLSAIAAGVLIWFGEQSASWTHGKVMDLLFSDTEVNETMTKEEIDAIAEDVLRILKNKAGEQQAGKIYQELQRDDAVKGVGVTTSHAKRPRHIVPRSEFPGRGKVVTESAADGIRSETTVQTLTLISPVLVKGQRKWKFRQGKFEFGASIRDEEFLDRVLSGREPILMSDGIMMKVKLTVKEEKKDGVWQITSKTVDEVLEVSPSASHLQGDLLDSSEE
ncbi:hypothetical protein ACEQ6A_25610 [Rhizobium brockwellii]|uniref:hypothetical protein n=1 Tax=Rhizobium brockwellii TaxID=3019932 RepID=UPI003F999369